MTTPFVGEIQLLAFNWAPVHTSLCDGQALPISDNTTLFSLIGTTFGGDGRTNFYLPDLRGRTPVHLGGDITFQGQKGGLEDVTLTESTMAAHHHPVYGTAEDGDSFFADGATFATSQNNSTLGFAPPVYNAANNLRSIASGSISSAGGGQSHPNMQPFLVISFIIALEGDYPARN
ncbi:MAG: phage tail protein [Rhodospirillaceae bacterium]